MKVGYGSGNGMVICDGVDGMLHVELDMGDPWRAHSST